MTKTPEILYEDPHLVLVRKPAGWLSQPGKDGSADDCDLVSYLEEQERARRRIPVGSDVVLHDPYIGVVHRLDRGVGGVMVYVKKPRAAAVLSDMVQKRDMTKQYLCIVHGIPAEKEGEYRDYLFRDAKQNKVYVVDRVRNGVKEAVLSYRVLETVQRPDGETLSLLLVTLGTGRSHQIRAQLSHHGTPIVADGKYGGRRPGGITLDEGEIALYSHHLAFAHPANVPGGSGKTKGKKARTGKPAFADIDCRVYPDAAVLPWGWFRTVGGGGE
ncbi:MAG: RluA family pseudouridine synthase [Clostridia bacterium]|nr:RluA family pseudouridine synthase [Clostridia bacterium]